MNMTHLLSIGIVGIVLGLAGCASVSAEAELKYDGAASGNHTESVECDDQGTVQGSGNVPDGEVTLTLRDAAGKLLLQQTFKGEFKLDERAVSGTAGSWTVSAQRSGDDLVGDAFRGLYAFYVDC